jgi:hypothetical protein
MVLLHNLKKRKTKNSLGGHLSSDATRLTIMYLFQEQNIACEITAS